MGAVTDDVVAFLRAAHEEIERVASAAINASNPPAFPGGPRRHRDYDDAVGFIVDECTDATLDAAHAHALLHDPRSALARVQAERAVLDRAVWERDRAGGDRDLIHDAQQWLGAVCLLAHGHRHTIPGWREEWTPEGVEVTA